MKIPALKEVRPDRMVAEQVLWGWWDATGLHWHVLAHGESVTRKEEIEGAPGAFYIATRNNPALYVFDGVSRLLVVDS